MTLTAFTFRYEFSSLALSEILSIGIGYWLLILLVEDEILEEPPCQEPSYPSLQPDQSFLNLGVLHDDDPQFFVKQVR